MCVCVGFFVFLHAFHTLTFTRITITAPATKEVHGELKLMIEPSAGVGVAAWKAIMQQGNDAGAGGAQYIPLNRRQDVVIILCGGNIDLELFYEKYK